MFSDLVEAEPCEHVARANKGYKLPLLQNGLVSKGASVTYRGMLNVGRVLQAELSPTMLKPIPLAPQNVTMFGNETFKGVTEVKWCYQLDPNPMSHALTRGGDEATGPHGRKAT